MRGSAKIQILQAVGAVASILAVFCYFAQDVAASGFNFASNNYDFPFARGVQLIASADRTAIYANSGETLSTVSFRFHNPTAYTCTYSNFNVRATGPSGDDASDNQDITLAPGEFKTITFNFTGATYTLADITSFSSYPIAGSFSPGQCNGSAGVQVRGSMFGGLGNDAGTHNYYLPDGSVAADSAFSPDLMMSVNGGAGGAVDAREAPTVGVALPTSNPPYYSGPASVPIELYSLVPISVVHKDAIFWSFEVHKVSDNSLVYAYGSPWDGHVFYGDFDACAAGCYGFGGSNTKIPDALPADAYYIKAKVQFYGFSEGPLSYGYPFTTSDTPGAFSVPTDEELGSTCAADDSATACVVKKVVSFLFKPSETAVRTLYGLISEFSTKWPLSWITQTGDAITGALNTSTTSLGTPNNVNPLQGQYPNTAWYANALRSLYGSWAGPASVAAIWIIALFSIISAGFRLLNIPEPPPDPGLMNDEDWSIK